MPAASIRIVSALATLVEPTSFQSQMMLLGGFVILTWVLIRRTIRAKKRERIASAEWKQQQRQTESANASAVPLATAPVELLRWQGAMFDLQRELKAELETKISVLQAMVQLADQRIATLQRLESGGAAPAARGAEVQRLAAEGMPAAEIAAALRVPLGEIERLLSPGN